MNVTFPDGSTGSVVVDASGNYSIDSPAGVGQPNGDVVVTLTDGTGNLSEETVVAYADTTAPEAPTAGITVNPDGSITVGGSAEPGSNVTVTFPDGSTGSVVVDGTGQYELVSPPGQGTGSVEVGVVDVNGNPSDTT
ncbi:MULTISPECIES: Ig-like domain-containing protein, partial [unclassified Pseudomonas]|uniref:Ig-like domain-containing protein n=1 Tax=unclassified Pseudomonas TaxID=196821 RepID=UPI0021145E82